MKTYLALSAFAVGLVLIIAWFAEPVEPDPQHRYFLAMGFIFCCILGIGMANKKVRCFSKPGSTPSILPQHRTRKRIGHHPDCRKYDSHRIRLGRKYYCAGCLGLSRGCVVALVICLIYVFEIEEIPWNVFTVLMGLVFVLIGFLGTSYARESWAHFVQNLLLVVGFFFVTFGLFEITGIFFYGIIGIIFSFLWLDTRIQLSKSRHPKICKRCRKTCKSY